MNMQRRGRENARPMGCGRQSEANDRGGYVVAGGGGKGEGSAGIPIIPPVIKSTRKLINVTPAGRYSMPLAEFLRG